MKSIGHLRGRSLLVLWDCRLPLVALLLVEFGFGARMMRDEKPIRSSSERRHLSPYRRRLVLPPVAFHAQRLSDMSKIWVPVYESIMFSFGLWSSTFADQLFFEQSWVVNTEYSSDCADYEGQEAGILY